jgi:hypothetical protein
MRMEIKIYILVSAETIITCLVFYKGKGNLKKVSVLSYGINSYADLDGKTPGVHAEEDAINKLMPLKIKKNLETVDLLVIRLSKTNKIQSSKPCANCIRIMKSVPQQKGYKIRYVYYSNSDGAITRTNLKTLECEEQHISRYYKWQQTKDIKK